MGAACRMMDPFERAGAAQQLRRIRGWWMLSIACAATTGGQGHELAGCSFEQALHASMACMVSWTAA